MTPTQHLDQLANLFGKRQIPSHNLHQPRRPNPPRLSLLLLQTQDPQSPTRPRAPIQAKMLRRTLPARHPHDALRRHRQGHLPQATARDVARDEGRLQLGQ